MGSHYTDFLAPASSFLTGAAALMNLSGGFFQYNCSESDAVADARALRNDFAMVGQDIRGAMRAANNVPGQLELKLS